MFAFIYPYDGFLLTVNENIALKTRILQQNKKNCTETMFGRLFKKQECSKSTFNLTIEPHLNA